MRKKWNWNNPIIWKRRILLNVGAFIVSGIFMIYSWHDMWGAG